jgi:hypothetical protein
MRVKSDAYANRVADTLAESFHKFQADVE